jgi:hypothetical protein
MVREKEVKNMAEYDTSGRTPAEVIAEFEKNSQKPGASKYELIEIGGEDGGTFVSKEKPDGEVVLVKVKVKDKVKAKSTK